MPRGFRAGGVGCGLKADGELDLGLLVAEEPVAANALFTQNRLVGAHVTVCRRHLATSGGRVRAVLVNSKNANCATGETGVQDAVACCAALAQRLDCPTEQVLMVSTGVIGAPLPRQRILDHLDALVAATTEPNGGIDFARAIMTTDTYPKAISHAHDAGRVTGFAKGSGMIHPDLATMLAFYLTDQPCGDQATAQHALTEINDRSMQRVTVDGDTSPNDTVLLLHPAADPARSDAAPAPVANLTEVAQALARHIAADGEGASRLVTVEVRGAASERDAMIVGRVIATSPLVKTAIAGRDPNWGRIVSAAGRADIAFDPGAARVWVGPAEVFRHGRPAPEAEPRGAEHLQNERAVRIGIDLGMGSAAADVWTCDLTADYIHINADYRT